jgi:hypothetical protein
VDPDPGGPKSGKNMLIWTLAFELLNIDFQEFFGTQIIDEAQTEIEFEYFHKDTGNCLSRTHRYQEYRYPVLRYRYRNVLNFSLMPVRITQDSNFHD